MIDLITALQLHGIFITDFNLLELRPMLNNTHGIFAAYWDGSAHYILQLSAIILFCLQENYREIGLYWCGSFINFMLLLLEGAILGNTEKGWLCFLNVPFLLLAVCVAIKFIRERPFQTRSYRKISSIVYRPLDLFFAICFVLAIAVAFLRGFAVLGANVSCMDFYLKEFEPYLTDPSAFPKVQMLVNMYYFVFYYVCAINGLVNPGQLWMSDWAIIHAGATIQSQFVHMASSFHSYTPEELHATKTGMAGAVFWGVNLAPLVIAHLFALRCWSDPDNYGCTSSTTSRYSVLNRKRD
ncbi:transmembrane 6 superfamily member 1-like isoform X2 [Pomacea canaliculata]|nr:transmembrane 6 superfamily member 1-like isoform X2 [Pomacea canaliculata]